MATAPTNTQALAETLYQAVKRDDGKALPEIDVQARDAEGRTPLHYFLNQMGNLSEAQKNRALDYFRQKNADFNARDCTDGTPALFAYSSLIQKDLICLCAHGADLSLADTHGTTLAHCYAKEGLSTMLSALHGRGVSLNVFDKQGRSPAHAYATGIKLHDDFKTLRVLHAAGVDLMAKDANGATPAALYAQNRADDDPSARAVFERAVDRVCHRVTTLHPTDGRASLSFLARYGMPDSSHPTHVAARGFAMPGSPPGTERGR